MNTEAIRGKLDSFSKIMTGENSRYKSWEHCYSAFHNARGNDNNDLEHLCLHLAFYLASWGMYRGSSFLLERDYLIHKEAVKLILNKKYDQLLGIKWEELTDPKESLSLLFELKTEIKEIYFKIRKKVRSEIVKNHISDTLVTKILLGCLGCVPAYDNYFKKGIQGIGAQSFNESSLRSLIAFYKENKQCLNKYEFTIQNLDTGNINYPQMKVLDMLFWQNGCDIDKV